MPNCTFNTGFNNYCLPHSGTNKRQGFSKRFENINVCQSMNQCENLEDIFSMVNEEVLEKLKLI